LGLSAPSILKIEIPAGTTIYQKYTYPRPLYHQIIWQGNIKVNKHTINSNEYTITVYPGESDLYFAGGPEYPQTIKNGEEVQKLSYDTLLKRTRNWWEIFSAGRIDFEHQLPMDLPLREKLLQTIDDVSVLIKTQQAREGSVIAGYPFQLGYVRDQYGVSRGLLALGYNKEAKNILDFYLLLPLLSKT